MTQPFDDSSNEPGKVLILSRRDRTRERTPRREVVVGEKIVTILKDMFASWRLPKAGAAR